MTVLPLKLFFHKVKIQFSFTLLSVFLGQISTSPKKTASFSFVYLEKHSSELGYLDLVNKDQI